MGNFNTAGKTLHREFIQKGGGTLICLLFVCFLRHNGKQICCEVSSHVSHRDESKQRPALFSCWKIKKLTVLQASFSRQFDV